MSAKYLLGREKLKQLSQRLAKDLSDSPSAEFELFVTHYFASTSRSDLTDRGDDSVYENLRQAWAFYQLRSSVAPKIEIIHSDFSDKASRGGTRILILQNDMPFLVDSIRQALMRCSVIVKYINNAVLHSEREKFAKSVGSKASGKLRKIQESAAGDAVTEALICFDCVRIDGAQSKAVENEVRDTLKNVAVAVKDYPAMHRAMEGVRKVLLDNADTVPSSKINLQESLKFIAWLLDDHFTFLGYEKYCINYSARSPFIELEEKSVLGVSRFKKDIKPKVKLADLPKGARELIIKKKICSFAKSGTRSKVHRPAYCDYVLLKEFDSNGEVSVEHRFLGLYTSSVYLQDVLDIPLIRQKVKSVLKRSGFTRNGHNIKELLQVINVYPRDELFQVTRMRLLHTATEITRFQDLRHSRLFIRRDSYGKFFSCLAYVSRDNFSTKVRQTIQKLLQERLRAEEVEFTTYTSESPFTRVHFIFHSPQIDEVRYKEAEIEAEMARLIRPWEDYFSSELQEEYSDIEAGMLFNKFGDCFSLAYKESYSAKTAVADILNIQQVVETKALSVNLLPCDSDGRAEFSFKIFSYDEQLHLSDVDPILENLGLNIISEKTFRLQLNDDDRVWLHDFSLYRAKPVGKFTTQSKSIFEEAFLAIWRGEIDDDSFNELVTTAEIKWRDAALLRAYAAYLKQIQFGYSVVHIAETLSAHRESCRRLIEYFYELFDPSLSDAKRKKAEATKNELLTQIDAVTVLSEDSVLRAYLNLIDATLRTNYFQPQSGSESPKRYFSFKFDPTQISGMPRPKPRYEIFVFSRQVEGVHLRGGKVARGGLRWSDRREDYRTEVLGLVKAQQVKNSVIVPVGAKGGFVIKQNTKNFDRDDLKALGVACYKVFIRGLLDITDNRVGERVESPPFVVKRDDDDPYLVVAADKGTATFSDIANGLSAEYGFWLGDGFASGGSNGYDHKQMGITAKGAWVSVQRHFRELGKDIQKEDFTVVGIGDMSGDVFGNGMLLSKHICLLAAFNHLHIFIDPKPDSEQSFNERSRLFKKQGSSWADYDGRLVSKGGGIFSRTSKSIKITAQMKSCFDIQDDSLTPDQLISALLKSPVDLLWNGGIGTYAKASTENNLEVGDKANDSLRVNGNQLRCKVIGEGGNLGFTQLARIEYAMSGGVSLTDFIDNSAGVDCSDHEVNIKILLNTLHKKAGLTEKRRSNLLHSMTEEVSQLVLANNYRQVQTIGLANYEMAFRNKEYAGLISFLEDNAGLIRDLEFLPITEQLEERTAKQQYLARPEIAIVTSYMKMYLKQALVLADYIDDDYLENYLFDAFPPSLIRKYKAQILKHPLRKELVSTQLANFVVNLVGPSFIYRMVESTGAATSDVVKAAVIAKDIFGIEQYWQQIEALDYKVSADAQALMMTRLTRLLRRATRWLLRHQDEVMGFWQAHDFFSKKIEEIRKMFPDKLPPDFQEMYAGKYEGLVAEGVPADLAEGITRCEFLFPATSFIDISQSSGEKLLTVVEVYYAIGESLQLNWLGKMINQLRVSNNWQALARETYLDDLAWQQRILTTNIVATVEKTGSAMSKVEKWSAKHEASLSRAKEMVELLRAEQEPDYATFSVVLRELQALAQQTVVKH
ncbi:MAG: NAD-glutamate dehydrogenase [Pseudohongiellaceae bacterium]